MLKLNSSICDGFLHLCFFRSLASNDLLYGFQTIKKILQVLMISAAVLWLGVYISPFVLLDWFLCPNGCKTKNLLWFSPRYLGSSSTFSARFTLLQSLSQLYSFIPYTLKQIMNQMCSKERTAKGKRKFSARKSLAFGNQDYMKPYESYAGCLQT